MSGTEIKTIHARQVYTNRGNPGVEATVVCENGATGTAMCTSGVSVGTHEVRFNFDGGTKFNGKGVMGAVNNVNTIIAPAMKGVDAANQLAADRALLSIRPEAKLELGGNAVAAVSAAILKAGANALGIPLYRHVGGESAMYLPVPGVAMAAGHQRYGGGITTPGGKPTMSVMCFGFDTFSDASYACWDIHTRWAKKMEQRFGGIPNVRDFIAIPAGVFKNDEEIWDAMTETIIEAGYEGRAGFQMDVATDTYHNKEDGRYYGLFSDKPMTKDELYRFYMDMIDKFPFVILEDPFNEDDYETTAAFTKESGIQVVGDDLFTTNAKRLYHGVALGAANAILIKPNQIGTLTETLDAIQIARKNAYSVIISHRSGETESSAIADLAVGVNAEFIKAGAPARSERLAKYNRLLAIEEELYK